MRDFVKVTKFRYIIMRTFTIHSVITVKILPYVRIVEKTSVHFRMCLIVDRCVTTVEYVRIVYRSRLLDWIKSCCYIERYSPLDLFERQAAQTHVTMKGCKVIDLLLEVRRNLSARRVGVALQATVENRRPCMRNKILRSSNAK